MFETVIPATGLTLESALLCSAASIALGFVAALVYMHKNTYSKGFAITLVLLPVLVQTVIMMVNGNVGAGVAVLGAFSLVRFRSVPGSSKEICCIFFAMAIGLATGMGYLLFAALVTVLVGAVFAILSATRFGERPRAEKELRIVIPESIDYTEVFDDLFREYTIACELTSVKTTNLGSMYELRYHIALRDAAREKEFIDALRCRNGNLTIVCGRQALIKEEL